MSLCYLRAFSFNLVSNTEGQFFSETPVCQPPGNIPSRRSSLASNAFPSGNGGGWGGGHQATGGNVPLIETPAPERRKHMHTHNNSFERGTTTVKVFVIRFYIYN